MATLNSVRKLVAAVVALIGTVMICAVLAGLLMIFESEELRHKSQTALLAATPTIAGDELRSRGHYLERPLTCWSLPGHTKRHMRVGCSGSTTDRKRVQVIGAAEDKRKEEYFTILLNGRPLVQNANCLGADCRRKKD
ncbi:hypothetical protein HKK72_19715 [Actinomadura sp. HBU206391]|nr:hypothetical protein [Actinomadura sp. HBU206391]